MRFEISSLLPLATLFFGAVQAVDITFYSLTWCSTQGGSTYTVWGAANGVCYNNGWNSLSIKVNGIPGGAKGQAYWGTGCGSYATEGTGSPCLSGLNSDSVMRSANWFYPYKKLVRKDELEPLGPTRFSFKYELPDATSREIEIPGGENAAEKCFKLVEEKNFEELSKYPTFVKA